MRVRKKSQGLSVNAIGGNHVVLLGFDVTEAKRQGLLGFTISRKDHTENEEAFLMTFKTFKPAAGAPLPKAGSLVSSNDHPVQGFQWGDYTAKPDHQYTYTVTARYGKPGALTDGPKVAVDVKTGSEDRGTHAVYFNRGAAGSQAYARKFNNVAPDKITDPATQKKAFEWLSRGLEEAILAFIGQANSSRFALRASVYEFSWAPVLEAFAKADKNKADVKIVYDRRPKGPFEATEKAAGAAGIQHLMIPRKTAVSISHNKFIVLLKDGKPEQVWTGSTNFTEGGIFGQSNVGHIIRDPKVAQAYLDYWTRLSADPDFKSLRPANDSASPVPKGAPKAGTITPVFSPRGDLTALQYYADRMAAAREFVAFTAAFGVSNVLAPALLKKEDFLRYLLVETEGNKTTPKPTPAQPKPMSQFDTFQKIRKVPNNLVAKGSVLNAKPKSGDEAVGGVLHRWLAEKLTGLNTHVKFLHTKYMLLDALTSSPTLVSGSANFSSASTESNDENMVIVQGDTDLADVFLGEFLRLFDHFQFREAVDAQVAAGKGAKGTISPFLVSTDKWTAPFFKEGSVHFLERELFA